MCVRRRRQDDKHEIVISFKRCEEKCVCVREEEKAKLFAAAAEERDRDSETTTSKSRVGGGKT
jgi:hypothetical protein